MPHPSTPWWSWTACIRGGPLQRRRRLRLRLHAQMLQLVVNALNWECLGRPNAQVGAPATSGQQRVLGHLESQTDRSLRVPGFKADDLGHAADKFSSLARVFEELPHNNYDGQSSPLLQFCMIPSFATITSPQVPCARLP